MSSADNPEAGHAALIPSPKLEDDFYDWYARHDTKAALAASGNHDLVFIGDSITHLFEGDANMIGRGERIWAEFYGARKALNLGFGWDRTQNVLWRLDHGELAGQRPRLVVLLIGTNNLTETANAPRSSPAEIADGIAAVCQRIRACSPESQILLMGILPRGLANDGFRADIRQTNELLKEYAGNHKETTFLDIGDRFLDQAGEIPTLLMDDRVHPTEAGYRIWADAIEPIVAATIGQRSPM